MERISIGTGRSEGSSMRKEKPPPKASRNSSPHLLHHPRLQGLASFNSGFSTPSKASRRQHLGVRHLTLGLCLTLVARTLVARAQGTNRRTIQKLGEP